MQGLWDESLCDDGQRLAIAHHVVLARRSIAISDVQRDKPFVVYYITPSTQGRVRAGEGKSD